jgi:hypothetical protein
MSEIKGRVLRLVDLVRALNLSPNTYPTLLQTEMREWERMKDSDSAAKAAYIEDRIRDLANEARALSDEELVTAIAGRLFDD